MVHTREQLSLDTRKTLRADSAAAGKEIMRKLVPIDDGNPDEVQRANIEAM